MKISVVLVYLGFYGLIGFCCLITKSAWPLWALLLTPSLRSGDDAKEPVNSANTKTRAAD
jgi:hypothetical protein